MRDLLLSAAERAAAYLDALDQRSVAVSEEALARLAAFEEPLPHGPTEPAAVLALLDEIGSPATVASAGPRFFGFVIGGSLPAALAANWLAGAWDQNAGLWLASPVSAKLEAVALGWLVDLLGLPPGTAGAFVTGTTMANFIALAAARHAVLRRYGWDVECDGLFGAPPITVVIGEEAHPTLLRSLSLLGLGLNRVHRVPVDDQGRLRPDALPPMTGPTIVCTQAGNVNTGAFDPIGPICERTHQTGAWVHVDGAFGLWAAAAPARRRHAADLAAADSWAADAHKWLNVPYDSGLAFVREAAALKDTLRLTAAYLPQSGEREPSQFTPELSRRARGVEVWAALRSLGRSGVADLVERTCRHASRFAGGLRAAGYTILNEVVLNQVLVAFRDAETTRRVIAGVQADGTCWCGPSVWQGHYADLRIMPT